MDYITDAVNNHIFFSVNQLWRRSLKIVFIVISLRLGGRRQLCWNLFSPM